MAIRWPLIVRATRTAASTCSAFASKLSRTSGNGPCCSETPCTTFGAPSITSVYALAVAQTGKDPPDGYQHLTFPICGEPGGFQKSRWRIASLDQITQAAIEKTQPYNRLKPGKWFMPLVWLREIHNVDKHRFAHLTAVGSLPNEIATDARPGTYKALWNTAPALEGTPVFRLLLSEPNPDVRVDLNMTGAVILSAKGMDRPVSVYWITRHIRREVGLVCRYLSLFLPPE